MPYVSMKQMLETGVHFGHQTQRWNPKMRQYIFGVRNGIHIIDLQQTVKLYRIAHDKVVDIVASGGKVLFVGTKTQAQEAIKEEALSAGQFYIASRWLGGTLTNFSTIKKTIERLKKLESMFEENDFIGYSKKEVLHFQREKEKLESVVGGIKDMKSIPDLVFIIDPHKENIAVQECVKLGIPIVAVTDTNCDPEYINYVIPGNDDAIRSIKLFVNGIASACLEGLAMRKGGGGEEFVSDEELSQSMLEQTAEEFLQEEQGEEVESVQEMADDESPDENRE